MPNNTENVTTKFKVDISDLKKNITEANRQIKLANAEFKNATAGMDKWSDSADGLSAKIAQQSKIVDAEKSKLDALKQQLDRLNKSQENGKKIISDLTAKYDAAAKEYGENSDEAKKYAKQLVDAQAAQERNAKAVDDLRLKIINQDTAVKNASAQVNKYETALNDLENELKEDTKTADSAAKSVDKLNDETERTDNATNKAASGGISAFGVALGNLAANALTACIRKMKELATATINVGETFDTSMSKVQAISGATADDMEKLRDKAREMGETTQFTATEAGDALGYMAMAGWKTDDMLNGLEGVMNLASASGADLATTSDIVTDALTAFGLTASEAGHLANVMAVASANANTNVEMMGETFKYAAPVAGALGISMEDTATAIGLMANAGIKSSQAGTALRAGLSNLVKPSKQAATYMDKYNIELQKNDDGSVNLGATMQDLRSKMDGISESEQAAAASAIFGKNAMSGWLAIINASDADFEKLTSAINDSDNAAAEMSATMIDNLGGDITLMKSAFEGLGISIYDKFQKPLRDVVKNITGELIPALKELVNGDASKLEKLIIKFADKSLPKIGKTVSSIIRKGLPKIVKLIKDIAPSIVSAVGEIAVQLIAALLSSTPDLVRAILSIVTNLLSTLTREFPNIINALVEIVPELIAALTDPKTMSELLNGAVTLLMAIVDAVPVIINALLPQIPVIVDNVCKMLIDNTPVLLAASVELFMALVQAIPAVILELIPALGGILQAIYDNFIFPVKTKFTALWSDIKTIFTPATKWFKQKFTAAYSAIKTAFSNVGAFFKSRWNDVKNAFGNVNTWFEEKFTSAWTAIKGVFENVGEFFGGIWDIIKEKFTTVGTDVGDAIGGAFKTAINAVIETVENALNAIPSAINDMIDEINKLPGVEIDTIPTVSLPRLAKGGIVNRATLAEIGENGAEAIIPLERNKAGLKKIAALIADEIGAGALGAGSIKGGNVYNFTQTNNSPKSLSRYEIYRQTKNLINAAKLGVV